MGSDFDFTVDANGQPQLLYIDKGQLKKLYGFLLFENNNPCFNLILFLIKIKKNEK